MVTASWECVTTVRSPLGLCLTFCVCLGLSFVHALVQLALAQRHEGLAYQQQQQGKHKCSVNLFSHFMPLIPIHELNVIDFA